MKINYPKRYRYFFILLIAFSGLSAHAGTFGKDSLSFTKEIYAGMNFSTMGLGVSISKSITKRIDFRLNGSYFGYTYDINKLSTEIQGDAGLRVGVVGSFMDYYIGRFFYLSAGASYNLTKVKIKGQLKESIEVGDILLDPVDIGALDVDLAPGWKVNPYLGLGLNFRHRKKLNLGLDVGLFFQNSPDVTLRATGMLEPTASMEQELLMEKNISPLIYYPYISLRLAYRIKL